MSAAPPKRCAPLGLERREGRFTLNFDLELTVIGLLAAILWYVTGDSKLAIALCPDGALRARGCLLLARLRRLLPGVHP
jgi:hypothetical protein